MSPQQQMQSPFLDLLRQIDSGVVIYEPFGRTPEKLREFDDTVARLQEMGWLGLAKKLFTQRRARYETASQFFILKLTIQDF